MRHHLALIAITTTLFLVNEGAPRADVFGSLDSACGAAITNADCLDVASTFPEALGGATGVLEAIKSQINGADDCKSKLTGGIPLVQDVLKYIDVPGLPVGELIRCSCQITYSQASCTGEVGKVAGDIWDGIKGFVNGIGDALGLGGGHSTSPEEFYQAFYEPMVNPSLAATPDQVSAALVPLNEICNLFWNFIRGDGPQLCGGFLQRFNSERQTKLDQIAKIQQAAQKAHDDELTKKAKEEAEKKAKQEADAAATKAAAEAAKAAAEAARQKQIRDLALALAKINQGIYDKQCKDTQCLNDITLLSFLMYLDFVSAGQKTSDIKTVEVAMGKKYQPLFKAKVADSMKREQVKQQEAQLKLMSVAAALRIKLANAQKISRDFSAFALRKQTKNPQQLVRRVIAARLKQPNLAR
jgi:hypothetical protein